MTQKFTTPLIARGPKGAWTYIAVPFDVVEVFGTKARVPVTGTINGFVFRNSLTPMGDGTHIMSVSKALQEGAQAKAGDQVTIVLERDDAARTVEVPPALSAALKRDSVAQKLFAVLAYSHQKAFTDWIAGAKRPETVTARVEKTLLKLKEDKRL